MIRRLYDAYVDRLAADRGVVAFVKWFCLGFVLEVAFMLPAVPLLAVGVAISGDAGMDLAAISFIVVFMVARVFLFAMPCLAVAERKGLRSPAGWAAGGFVFGQVALGVIAALPPKAPAAAR